MTTAIKADGDTWRPQLGGPGRPGFRVVVFFCASNGQRPYRVTEVPEDRFASQADLDRLPQDEIRKLFGNTTSMGVPQSFD